MAQVLLPVNPLLQFTDKSHQESLGGSSDHNHGITKAPHSTTSTARGARSALESDLPKL